jgi:hypothetical protein
MSQQLDLTTRQQLASEGIHLYDNTMLLEYVRCPFAFNLRFNRNLLPVGGPVNHGLEFGVAIHSALANWFTNKDEDRALDVFRQAFEPFEEQPTVSPKTNKPINATYTLIFGSALLSTYIRKYENDSRELVGNELALGEELAPGVFVMGILDKILKSRDGTITFMDHKTSKYYNSFQLIPNPQFHGYKFLCETFTGKKVAGELDMIGIAKNKPADELLFRTPFDYSHDQMQRWKDATLMIVEEIERSRQLNKWERRWNCKPFFKDCPYLPLCTSPTDASIEPLLERMYKVQVWDPFESTT